MGEGIALALRRAGAGHVVVVNRTPERGHSLAERVDGEALGFDRLGEVLADADVVITCTGAGSPGRHACVGLGSIVRRGRVARCCWSTSPFLATSMPMSPASPAWSCSTSTTSVPGPSVDAPNARPRSTVSPPSSATRSTDSPWPPLPCRRRRSSARLRDRAEQLRLTELHRYERQMTQLDDEQRELVDVITRGVIAKLLHEPSVRLRDQAGSPRGERNAAAVADLFDLG